MESRLINALLYSFQLMFFRAASFTETCDSVHFDNQIVVMGKGFNLFRQQHHMKLV
jgi:hypothetical protein